MVKRTLSGIILAVVLVAAFIEGRYILLLLLCLASLAGLRELYQTVGKGNKKLSHGRMDALAMTGYGVTLLYYVMLLYGTTPGALLILLLAALLLMMLIYVARFPMYEPVDFFVAFFGLFYVPIMLSTVYLTRQREDGLYMVWFVFVGSWVCDTFAYFVGSAIGKHKMAPVLSPKKSWEGAVGGVLGSAVTGLVAGIIIEKLRVDGGMSVHLLYYVLISVVCAVFSQVGDLTASAVKRHYEVKDYGGVIPGHGGILDRFDSMIVTGPLIYILLTLFV